MTIKGVIASLAILFGVLITATPASAVTTFPQTTIYSTPVRPTLVQSSHCRWIIVLTQLSVGNITFVTWAL